MLNPSSIYRLLSIHTYSKSTFNCAGNGNRYSRAGLESRKRPLLLLRSPPLILTRCSYVTRARRTLDETLPFIGNGLRGVEDLGVSYLDQSKVLGSFPRERLQNINFYWVQTSDSCLIIICLENYCPTIENNK